MKKTVFRPNEVTTNGDDKLVLQLCRTFTPPEPEEEAVEEAQEYTGPTAEDLRKEAEDFKAQWAQEKEGMIAQAQSEAEKIKADAEKVAFDAVKHKSDEAQVIVQNAKDEAQKLIAEAQAKAAEIEEAAQKKYGQDLQAAHDEGFPKGESEGFAKGSDEVERLIERVHLILESTVAKREEILVDTEQQIVDLVLLMTRKVVKVIADSQKNVVVANVLQALRKIKKRGEVTVRVNMADVGLATQHAKDFIKSIEGAKNLTVVEDSTVDKGGCIIETDFGAVDARIASQLAELEQKILEISPVRTQVRATEGAMPQAAASRPAPVAAAKSASGSGLAGLAAAASASAASVTTGASS